VGNRKCFSLSFLPTVPLLINFTVIFTKKEKEEEKRITRAHDRISSH
jgi:hypothetical protein